MSGFGLLLVLAGTVVELVAIPASCSQRVRMAMPVPVEWSEIWLIIIGLICQGVGILMMAI